MASDPAFPLLLHLAGRRCLVVGAGAVGRRRVAGLCAAGARVTLVAPELPAAGLPPQVEQQGRPFQDTDVAGATLVFAATDDAAVNAAVAAAARRHGIPCHRADAPQDSDFTLPAVLRRGALTLTVATGGESPVLAQLLRDRLGRWFSPAWGELVTLAGAIRRGLRDSERQRAVLEQALGDDGPAADAQRLRRFRQAAGDISEEDKAQ